MPKLRFEIDWVDAQGVSGPELSATWAFLRMLAGDSAVTRVLDARAQTVREFVYVPLYPLAEWLVTNWWFLSYEIATPAKEGDPDFHRRHALSANREGYAFPNLEVVPSGARTHLVWTEGRSPWTGVEFLSQGDIWIDSGDFRETCADLVDRVIRRLESLGVDNTFLQAEWTAIQSVDEEESGFCKTAAGLGWDPYALDDTGRVWVPLVADNLGDLLDETLPALDAQRPATCFTITNAIERARRNDLPLERLRFLRNETRPDAGIEPNPWSAGYALARQLRQNLELDDGPIPTLKSLAEAIGEDLALLRKATRPVGVPCRDAAGRRRSHPERQREPGLCISPSWRGRQTLPLLPCSRRSMDIARFGCVAYKGLLRVSAAQSRLCSRIPGAFVRAAKQVVRACDR